VNQPLYLAVPAITLVALASATDLASRRVPNVLTGSAILLAVVVHGATSGWSGVGASLGGAAIAGALLLPGWLAGWMGAGDVKLMAAVGAWLGMSQGVRATLLALIAAGVLAVIVAVRHRVLLRSIAGAASLARWAFAPHFGLTAPRHATTGIKFPFAVAAFAGVCACLWMRS